MCVAISCGIGQQPQLRFDTWPWNFHMPQVQLYKKKKSKMPFPDGASVLGQESAEDSSHTCFCTACKPKDTFLKDWGKIKKITILCDMEIMQNLDFSAHT